MSTIDPVLPPARGREGPGLETGLRERFDVVEQRVSVGGRTFELRHPRSADDLIDEEAFNRDERLPYWAEIWPSAFVLAERIFALGVRGPLTPALSHEGEREKEKSQSEKKKKLRVLELGCGSGLAVVAALVAGFEVTAADYYAEALEFVALNAALNGLPRPELRVVDWREYPAELVGFDVVIAADVLYERDYCRLVAAAFRQSLKPGGLGLLTDPQRSKAETFPAECVRAGLTVGAAEVFGPLSVPGGDAAVRQTVNLFEVRRGE